MEAFMKVIGLTTVLIRRESLYMPMVTIMKENGLMIGHMAMAFIYMPAMEAGMKVSGKMTNKSEKVSKIGLMVRDMKASTRIWLNMVLGGLLGLMVRHTKDNM
jgi:hypothetical protein